ncbi:hypothetical protein A3B18_03695 [Candidatus Giovannonibacteria bacterium RIFCSPLOWO2_01_FULL_46_13]|uniref:DUF5666 domain-containing protein n=1 Tax=Candidatus Giovannonibacteria bacterium RIFCSPLOWO2_01_FULL_46_13 TaxID=1798352 RepID=A0A1F5X3E2_9BACT|nr:MAG: hypothetical protein A3B18_03695 [Candidatus Giovannonibacteria bacterium RIFCSPLOWO2_01_FULL_46_13]
MTKKYITVILVMTILSVGLFSPAYADNDNGRFKNLFKRIDKSIQKLEKVQNFNISQSFSVEGGGEARIRGGTISNTASSTITVKVWGLDIDVNTVGAKITHNDNATTTLKVGDKVNVKGKMETGGILKASSIELLLSGNTNPQITEKIRKLIERLREIERRAGLPLTPFPSATSTSSN